mgnify:CR=1 FL=1
MSEFVAIRKQRTVGTKHKHPKVCLSLPKGEFRFYKQTCELLNIDPEKQGLMFYLNKEDKKVKIELEEKLDDNYHLSDRKGYKAFTNKSIGITFSDVFDLDFDGTHYFRFEKKDSEYIMTLL